MTIAKIVHISDIHIRNGDVTYCRYSEYINVFNNLFESIIKNVSDPQSTLIIITGDIFHNKTNIGSYGLYLYKQLLTKLLSITKVVIIAGNHDVNQSDNSQPSLLYASTFESENLYLLNDTSITTIENIDISFVAIQDTLDPIKTCGRLQELPEFPKSTNKSNYNIALFHGTFANIKINHTTSSDVSQYPFKWIEDFDYVLLGDIHLRQTGIYKEKTLWGYSGSLIQQNYGEDIINHGYMIWDLESKKISEINVYNNKGFVYLKEKDDEILINYENKYINLEKFIKKNYGMFPKYIEIKIFSDINYINLNTLLTSYNIKYKIVSTSSHKIDNNDIITNSFDSSTSITDDLNSNKYMIEYFKEYLTESQYNILTNILENKETLLLTDYNTTIENECIKKNKEINQYIIESNKSDNIIVTKSKFRVLYIEWNNLYCYHENNHINFENLDLKTFLISGNNGMGKSSIFNIILLALWGENLLKSQVSIINSKKNSATTTIHVETDGEIYKIVRTFTLKEAKIIKKTIITNHTKNVKIKEDNSSKEFLINKIGTLDDFITNSMITQNVDNDILKLDYKESLLTFDKILNLENIQKTYNLFKTTSVKYKDIIKSIVSKMQVYSSITVSPHTEDSLKSLKHRIDNIIQNKKTANDEYDNIYIDLKNINIEKILNTDYDDVYENEMSEEEYKIITEEQSKIDIKLGIDKIESLASKYSDDIEYVANKPCDISFIKSEEKSLADYTEPEKIEESEISNLETYKSQLEELTTQINSHNDSRPARMKDRVLSQLSQPLTLEEIEKEILKWYNSIEELNEYCTTLKSSYNTGTYNNTRTYKEVLGLIEKHKENTKSILQVNNDIIIIEDELNKKQLENIEFRNKNHVNKPKTGLTFEVIEKNIKKLKTKKKKIDIGIINVAITSNETIINDYNMLKEELKELTKEYDALKSDKNYDYNPLCEVCCSREYVKRIYELEASIPVKKLAISEIIISEVTNELETNLKKREEYNAIIEYIEASQKLLEEYDLYNKFKEIDDKHRQEIVLKSDEKTEKIRYRNDLIKTNEEIQNDIDIFNEYSYYYKTLYQELHNRKKYNKWLSKFNKLNALKEQISTNINKITKYNSYNEILKRKNRLEELKKYYDNWYIINSYNYLKNKALITTYEINAKRLKEKHLKPLIIRKNELKELSVALENEYNELYASYISLVTEYNYSKKNKEEYEKLSEYKNILNEKNEIIEIIIDKFIFYRKWIYETIIMPSVVKNSNTIIKSLCHENAKSFELGFSINLYKNELIHIKWLIDDNICVDNASGFQKFVISFAIRLTINLISNKYNKNCEQLFIDEGFVSFDKDNLTIVPSFLKNLLKYYRTIVLVSHIDIIRDNIDDMISIKYDSNSNVSRINYG